MGYAANFIATHWGPMHPFPVWSNIRTDTGIFHINTGEALATSGVLPSLSDDDAEVRIALTADWGAGTRESDIVAKLMLDKFAAHYTFHLGDFCKCSFVAFHCSLTVRSPRFN
jgi:hypothetical protein